MEDLSNILQTIRPFPQAPPRIETTHGRKRGKTTILTSDESYAEVRAERERETRDAKEKAKEERKANAAAKKVASAAKKWLLLRKKLLQKKNAATSKKTVSAAPKIARSRMLMNHHTLTMNNF